MSRRLFAAVIIAVIGLGLTGLATLAQSAPARPRRNPDTGEVAIGRVPAAEQPTSMPRLPAPPSVSLSASGMADWSRLVYQTYVGNWDIYAANGDGTNPQRLTSSGAPDITPRFNRGAARVAYASSEPGNYEIYTMNTNGSGKVRLTNQAANDYQPAWSPDGARIAFNSYRDGQSEIYVMSADGTNLTRLTYDAAYDGQPVWSPDGSKLAFLSDRSGIDQIWVMNANGSGATPLTTQPYSEDPAWSPDGTRLAYDADADGDGWQELMVVNADGTNAHVIGDTLTTADMWARSWSPDGRLVAFTAIYFINYQGNWYWTQAYLYAVDAVAGGAYALSTSDVAWNPDWQTTDLLPPTSSMTALPATSPGPVTVRWTGSDAGPSGILGYDVQVKEGAGTWTMWLTRTAATSSAYPGIGGHTYSFRVRAVDNSTNFQVWPAVAQASTTVEALPPIATVDPLPKYHRGPLPVSWAGTDPGNSGIKSYDVQYRDDLIGTWTDWRTGTTQSSAEFNGDLGHAYAFRVRATDRAQNLGGWSDPSDQSPTTFYQWAINGSLVDNRGQPVIDAAVTLSPAALNAITSTLNGYLAYLTDSGEYTLTAAHLGYGPDTSSIVSLTDDSRLNLSLPPIDDLIVNGSFEDSAPIPPGWHLSGELLPHVGSDAHDGRKDLQLRSEHVPLPGAVEPVGTLDGHSPDLAVGPGGDAHVVYVDQGAVWYTRRFVTGTWTVPVTVTDHGLAPAIAVGPTGTVGIAWNTAAPDLLFRTLSTAGIWSEPMTAAVGAWGPDMAAGSDGSFHLTFSIPDVYSPWIADAAYQARSPAGTWSAISRGSIALGPRIMLDSANSPYIAIDNFAGQGMNGLCIPSGDYMGCSAIDYGSGTRIARGPADSLHLLWRWWLGADRYAVRTASGWFVTEELTPPTGPGDLGIDSDGAVHVANTDALGVYYRVRRTDGTWLPALTITSTGSGTPVLIVESPERAHVIYQPSISTTLEYVALRELPQTLRSAASQSVTIPIDLHRPTLSFWYRGSQIGLETPAFFVSVDDGTGAARIFTATVADNWTLGWADVSHWAGQAVTITFSAGASAPRTAVDVSLDEITLGSWLTPQPQVVSPFRVGVAVSSVITITGDNFFATPQARLNDVPLPDVTWISPTTLTATVPGLPIGRYDLIVTNPGGQASGLPRALLVGYEVFLPIMRR